MGRSIWKLGLWAIGLALVIGLAGCTWIETLLHPGGTGHPWASGDPVSAASSTIGTAGGTIVVSDPGGPLDGMAIDVPAGAYPNSTSFEISYTPITGSIDPDIDPLTPLISVDNGGNFADGVITVTIPVTIPDGYFAMGFFVDEDGDLEGMPLVAETPTSITVATAHFSDFFISKIADSLLTGIMDTGFRPMTDDWQFPNNGSYIEPRGHCAGQSLTAMWYYYENTLNGTSTLYGRFDNNGDTATPELWQDDSLGYRLASTVQADIDWDNWLRQITLILGDADDEFNWNAFLYAMLVTGEPQYVAIYSATGGHAMIVYKADANTGTLYVADPNYPGHSGRKIRYANGAFSAYESGANAAEIAAGNSTTYTEIRYFAKTAVIPWAQIATRWSEFEFATIGDQTFPGYQLSALGSTGGGVPLVDGMTYSGDTLKIGLSADDPAQHRLGYFVYRDDQRLTVATDGSIDLVAGENHLGIYVLGETGGSWKYVDFQRLTVNTASAGYAFVRVDVHGFLTIVHPNDPDPDTGTPGYTYQDDDPFEVNAFSSYAGRSFTGNTFHAQWSNWSDPLGTGPFSGSMTITFSDNMDEVLSFSASDSHAYDGHVLMWAASGSNIPLDRIGNGFYEYIVDGAECCSHISSYADNIAWAGGNTITLTHFTCDVTARIQIEWYEQPPAWASSRAGIDARTSDVLQASPSGNTPEEATEREPQPTVQGLRST
ncbi:hypothetical protein JW848_01345 [Candidatus Bipolaricaulota bacterium]|nr:hypothetical protein [Candidatus Bipolaricaulota bacterium]